MRGAAILAVALAAAGGAAAQQDGDAPVVVAAEFHGATTRYRHHIMGHIPPWAELHLAMYDGTMRRIVLPETAVFEDVAPRLADLDGDGAPEVVVVETHVAQGGSLAVYGPEGKIAATPHIGRPQRWLAPAGIADFDGDGAVEIGYVDRPHLAKVLRLWRFEGGTLTEVAQLGGVTNHSIGQAFIPGGVRDCGGAPEMIVATADWSLVLAVGFDGQELTAREIGPADGPESLDAATRCTG